jgi:hypothetical protein
VLCEGVLQRRKLPMGLEVSQALGGCLLHGGARPAQSIEGERRYFTLR